MEKLVNFGPFKGPTQRVIQRWFDDATVHHSSLCPSMQLAWCSAGSASDPEAWPGQSWEPYVCMIWGNSLSISQMQTPIPLEDVPLSLFLQIIFFFLSCSGFFLLCPAFFLIHHLPFPIFISPFWPWRLQSLALTTLWHMSLIAVEGKSWVDENGHGAGQGGWTQGPPSAQGTGLRTWSEGHHSHGCHWRWVVYIPPILLLCSALCPDLRWNKSWNQSPGIRVLGGGNLYVKCKADVGLVCLPPTLPAECPGGGPEPNSALDKRTRVWAQSRAGLWDFFLNNSSIYTLGYSSHMWLMALFSNLEEVSQRTVCFCRQMSKLADRWGTVR